MQSVEEQIVVIKKGVFALAKEEELRSKLLRSQKDERPLLIKLGLDPSAPDIHLGHTVVLRKLRQFQELGHQIVIVIGDFTGMIGDPTGKSKTRKALSKEQVAENAKTYCNQIFKVLKKEQTFVQFNSEWLSKMNFEEVLKLAATTTVARLLEREDFKNRYQEQSPIGLHEFFYPLMQGMDSVHLKADIEIGGTDQTFNIMMGRTLQRIYGQEEQIALFMPILEGLDGVQKMSKSLGNYIGIEDEAKDMYGKLMTIPDSLILRYFELVTDVPTEQIGEYKKSLEEGENPKFIKKILAETITSYYHSEEATKEAVEYFKTVFEKKEVPEVMEELILTWEEDRIIDVIPLLTKAGYVASNSEFRRLLKQGGVKRNGEVEDDLESVLYCGDVLKIGKKTFLRIIK